MNIYYVVSGKGGVGKSFITSMLAREFASMGQKTLVIDANIGQRYMDMLLDVTDSVLYDYGDILGDNVLMDDAVTCVKDNLYLLVAPQDSRKICNMREVFSKLCEMALNEYECVFIDMPVCADTDSMIPNSEDSAVIVVSDNHKMSLRNADTLIMGLDESKDIKLIVNRVDEMRIEKGYDMGIDEVIDYCHVPLLGVIYEIEGGFDEKMNCITHDDESLLKQIFSNIALRLKGENIPIAENNKKSIIKKLFG